eukprot:15353137-Alexandrium_andersonii.AAC.1
MVFQAGPRGRIDLGRLDFPRVERLLQGHRHRPARTFRITPQGCDQVGLGACAGEVLLVAEDMQ